ncbi:hypothetical protein POTOM_020781 [Populus tomentosa]|uniref:Regulator of chromosome condensation family protein n=1 Tax=Populus tomentosa TaxID=118781 RepID=A0A8X8D0D1_POPTO|nr:hypothetical protein POTOM_020781 [Populus tomentosa]
MIDWTVFKIVNGAVLLYYTCASQLQEPLEVSGLKKEIVQISAGYHHSCAITVDGELYMWGKNSNGQLGLGKKAENVVPVPTKVECLSGINIKMVALASEHSIAVTDGGQALSWGGGGSGRLGHGHQSSLLGFFRSSSEYTPRHIKKLEGVKVKNIAAGLLHSACIDENGSVYIFGEKAVDKLVSARFGVYIGCSGELYTWGSNENGCLGNGYLYSLVSILKFRLIECSLLDPLISIDVLHIPERVEGPFLRSPVEKVSCGWKHTAAISEGNVFTWGWGGSHGTFSEDGLSSGGQLGHGDDFDYGNPTLVAFEKKMKALEVSCGFNHTGAILESVDA